MRKIYFIRNETKKLLKENKTTNNSKCGLPTRFISIEIKQTL